MFDRRQVVVEVSTENDKVFMQNLVTRRAEDAEQLLAPFVRYPP